MKLFLSRGLEDSSRNSCVGRGSVVDPGKSSGSCHASSECSLVPSSPPTSFTSLKIPPVFAKFINENSISLILYLRLVANVPWGPLYSLSHTHLCLYHKMHSTLRQANLTYTAAQARNDLPVTGHPKSFRTYFKFYIL